MKLFKKLFFLLWLFSLSLTNLFLFKTNDKEIIPNDFSQDYLISRTETEWSFHTQWSDHYAGRTPSLDQFKLAVYYDYSTNEQKPFYNYATAGIGNAKTIKELVNNSSMTAHTEYDTISTNRVNLTITGDNQELADGANFSKKFYITEHYSANSFTYTIPPLNVIKPDVSMEVTNSPSKNDLIMNFNYNANLSSEFQPTDFEIRSIILKNKNETIYDFTSLGLIGNATFTIKTLAPKELIFNIALHPKDSLGSSDVWNYNYNLYQFINPKIDVSKGPAIISIDDSNDYVNEAYVLTPEIGKNKFDLINIGGGKWETVIFPLEEDTVYDNWTLIVSEKGNGNFIFIIDLKAVKTLSFAPKINNFDAQLVDNKPTISWNFSDDTNSLWEINILRGKDGNDPILYHTISSSETEGTWVDENVLEKHSYSYSLELVYVDPFAGELNRIFSDTKTLEILSTVPLINSFDAILANNKITLSWDIKDDQSQIDQISLFKNGKILKDIPKEETNSTYIDEDLSSDENYNYQLVIKYHDLYDGLFFEINSEIKTISTAESKPIINSFTSTIDDSSIVVSWDLTDTSETITSLKILRNNEMVHQITDTTALVNSWTDTDLKMNQEYSYELIVEYKDSYDLSTKTISSTSVNLSTDDIAPSITSFSASLEENKAKIEWTIEDDASTITSISLFRDNIVIKHLGSEDLNNSFTDINLESNKTYNYQLKISYQDLYDGSGATTLDLNSSIESVTTANKMPSINSFEGHLDGAKSIITWDIDDSASIITSISLMKNGKEIKAIEKDDLTNQFDDTDLKINQDYNYGLIISYHDFYDSSSEEQQLYSQNITIKTDNTIPIINTFSASLGDFKTTINWDISDETSIINSISIARDGMVISNPTTLTGTYEDSNLTMDKTFNYQLIINYKDFYSGDELVLNSEVIKITTENLIPTINNFDASLSNHKTKVNWELSDGANVINSLFIYRNGIKVHEINNPKPSDLISSWDDKDLTMDENYNYQLIINFSDSYKGTSDDLVSSSIAIKTSEITPTVTSFNSELTSYKGIINWNILDNASSVTTITLLKNGVNIFTTDEIVGSYEDNDLEMNENYNYQLIINYQDFYSSSTFTLNSETSQLQTKNLIPTINSFKVVTNENNNVNIEWNITSEVTKDFQITIYRKNKTGTSIVYLSNKTKGNWTDKDVEFDYGETIDYWAVISYTDEYSDTLLEENSKNISVNSYSSAPAKIQVSNIYLIITLIFLIIIGIIALFIYSSSFKSRI